MRRINRGGSLMMEVFPIGADPGEPVMAQVTYHVVREGTHFSSCEIVGVRNAVARSQQIPLDPDEQERVRQQIYEWECG